MPQRDALPQALNGSNVQYRHAAIADLMIEQPELNAAAVALKLGLQLTYLNKMLDSDGFCEYFALRRLKQEGASAVIEGASAALVPADSPTPALDSGSGTLVDKVSGVANKALDAIAAKLDVEGANIPLKELNDTAARTLTALGFGSAPGGDRGRANNTQINVYTGAVSQADLAEARRRMEEEGKAKAQALAAPAEEGKVIDHEPTSALAHEPEVKVSATT